MDENQLRDIIIKATQGDKKAFAELCEEKGQHILYLCVKVMGDFHDGEDAAQEILLIMQRDIQNLQNPDAFKTWMYRLIVRNCGKMKKKMQLQTSLPIEEYGETASETREEFLPQQFLENETNKKLLLAEIDNLPDDCRVCLLLYYFDNLKYTEIAESLSITTNDVGNLLAKAKKLLLRGLAPQMGRPSATPLYAAAGATPLLSTILAQDAAIVAPKAAVQKLFKNSSIPYLNGKGTLGKTIAKVAAGTIAAATVATLGVAIWRQSIPPTSAGVLPSPPAQSQAVLEINTLNDMLGVTDADRLRAFGQQSADAATIDEFLTEIGMTVDFEGDDLDQQKYYQFYYLYRGGKLLMVITQNSTDGGAAQVAFKFTDDTETLLKHVETYLNFDTWQQQQAAY
ncbi:RNA polymerase sigma factor [Ruminococcaceae bacterium OttesenSCG-928-A16]|nr:RNA polymerase sigma factor [Ruminococcaceae bacterium OttesenSCG-928-A16]